MTGIRTLNGTLFHGGAVSRPHELQTRHSFDYVPRTGFYLASTEGILVSNG